MTRAIPGTIISDLRDFCYVQLKNDSVGGLFFEVVTKVRPPIPKRGGALEEMCIASLKNDERYFGISYKSEKSGIFGWKEQVEKGASLMGLKVARIVGDNFIVDDETTYSLDDCEFEFYKLNRKK